MKRKIEKYHPFILGLVPPLFYWWLFHDIVFSPNIIALYQAVINVSAIAVGFLITAQSILVALDSREIVTRMKQYQLYADMLKYFSSAINFSLSLCLVSGLILLTDTYNKSVNNQIFLHQILFYFWSYILSATVLSFLRIARIFANILRVIMTTDNQ